MGQKLGIVSFTEHGSQLNERLREMLERSDMYASPMQRKNMQENIICFH